MTSPRVMAQEYAKSGFAALLALNGGASVAMLTQASTLIDRGLADDVACALVVWAFGAALVPLGWLFGFISLRHLDRSECFPWIAEAEIRLSDRFMLAGECAFVLSLMSFIAGCVILARNLASLGQV